MGASISNKVIEVEDALLRRVAKVEVDVASLAQDVTHHNAERSVRLLDAEAEHQNETCTSIDVQRLARELQNDRRQFNLARQQFSLELQCNAGSNERLHALLNTTNQSLFSLQRDLLSQPFSGNSRKAFTEVLESLRKEIAGHVGTCKAPRRSAGGSFRASRFHAESIERIEEEQEPQQVDAVLGGSDASNGPFGAVGEQSPKVWSPTSSGEATPRRISPRSSASLGDISPHRPVTAGERTAGTCGSGHM